MRSTRIALAALVPCFIWAGCAASGGTGTGNPAVTIASLGYNSALAKNPLLDFFVPSAVASNSITSLEFCVSELKFVTTTGSSISVPKSALGVINLGNGSQNVTWGVVTPTAGTSINAVHVELEAEDACQSAGFTIKANGMTITSELEFHFVFSSPTTVGGTQTFTFSLTNLVSEINSALQAGQFNNADIGNYITSGLEDEAHDD